MGLFNKKKQQNNIFDIAHEKYSKKQKITYEEYVIILATNDEISFVFNDTEYQVVHINPEVTEMCISKIDENKLIFERSEKYSSIIDMLNNFRIDGKRIIDIWDNVSF